VALQRVHASRLGLIATLLRAFFAVERPRFNWYDVMQANPMSDSTRFAR